MKRTRAMGLLLLCLCLLLVGCASSDPYADAPLKLYFLDVGQGDCILLRTPAGDILIDSGPEEMQADLCRRLRRLGVTTFALAVFTHSDEDHIGGGDLLLEEFGAAEIWISSVWEENECARRLLQSAEECGAEICKVTAGKRMSFGDVIMTVLAPRIGNSETSNDSSIVLKVVCGEISALLTGDIEEAGERALLDFYGATHLRCDLYKVGHHGSSTSTGEELLRAMSPRYAVISCAAENRYGHPHGETLERLENAGVAVFRTDLDGEILFVCTGEELIPICRS
ncbi:MAG: MBL fold metallo-hydrolase [Clostridia bacterium]|nr:MBL fold metallo-hydrolase [Clostridia bacterium]